MLWRHDSHSIVKSCLEQLKLLTGGEVASFTVRTDGSGPCYSRCAATGTFASVVEKWNGAAMQPGAIHDATEKEWTLWSPRNIHHNRFARQEDDVDLDWVRRQPVYYSFYQPNAIEDQLRGLFYDDDGTFLGFVAAFRSDPHSFTEEERAAVNGIRRRIRRALRIAWSTENLDAPESIHAIVDERGHLVYASDFAGEWLTSRRIELVRRMVKGAHRRIIDGVRFDPLPMHQHGWTFLAGKPAPGYRVDTTWLSATQRAIASRAEAGFSNGEIAAQLGMSSSNVKYHLGVIYQRMGVSSRVELVTGRPGSRNTHPPR